MAERADRLMPSAAWLLAAICKRGSCRRARACRYGERPGDRPPEAAAQEAPCFAALPRPVRLALPFAMMRRLTPAAFRDPILLRREAEAIRAATGALAEMQGAATAGDAPAGANSGAASTYDKGAAAPAPSS